MADKNFNTVPVSGSINSSDYLHATIGGTHNRVLVSTLIAKAKSETLTEVEASLLDKLTDGCLVLFSTKSNNASVAVKASKWTGYQNSGEIASGVLLVSGARRLVVAPTWGTSLPWSSVETTVGETTYSRVTALDDFSGKEKTAAILANATIGSDGSGYAPGFCSAYSRPNSNGVGLTTGKWWLPSVGELMMIFSFRSRLDIVLPLISGASSFPDSRDLKLASCTEYSSSQAWRLTISPNLNYLGQTPKTSSFDIVIPVSDFLQ